MLAVIPTLRYYVSTPWINDCMINYVQQMKASNYEWNVYNINWLAHIEPANSTSNKALEQYKVWEAKWCLMTWDDLYSNFNNSVYCSITYIIQKSPMHSSMKEPLAIYSWWKFNL